MTTQRKTHLRVPHVRTKWLCSTRRVKVRQLTLDISKVTCAHCIKRYRELNVTQACLDTGLDEFVIKQQIDLGRLHSCKDNYNRTLPLSDWFAHMRSKHRVAGRDMSWMDLFAAGTNWSKSTQCVTMDEFSLRYLRRLEYFRRVY